MSLTVYAVAGGGFGYEVAMAGVVITQELLPSSTGQYLMSQSQATILGTAVELKLKKKLRPTLTDQQTKDLIGGTKTPTQVVNEELGIV